MDRSSGKPEVGLGTNELDQAHAEAMVALRSAIHANDHWLVVRGVVAVAQADEVMETRCEMHAGGGTNMRPELDSRLPALAFLMSVRSAVDRSITDLIGDDEELLNR